MSLISLMNQGDSGMLARSLMGNDWEVRHASLCCYKIAEQEDLHWPPCVSFAQASDMKEIMLCNPIYLPNLLPSIFCYFKEGALRLANPYVPFLFLWLFLLVFYLRLALSLPRPQIKQLGTFILYLTTSSAKIELFGHISFSNLQHKIETWHDPAQTVGSPIQKQDHNNQL